MTEKYIIVDSGNFDFQGNWCKCKCLICGYITEMHNSIYLCYIEIKKHNELAHKN